MWDGSIVFTLFCMVISLVLWIYAIYITAAMEPEKYWPIKTGLFKKIALVSWVIRSEGYIFVWI